MQKSIKIFTKSAEETKKVGELLAREIMKSYHTKASRGARASVVSLEGELGSGKTTFTQGFAKGLRIKENPRSPTFVIMRAYLIPPLRRIGKGMFSNFIHIDAYRITSRDLKILGWREFVKNPENIILIEWGNKIKNILQKNSLRIIFKHGKNSSERKIIFEN